MTCQRKPDNKIPKPANEDIKNRVFGKAPVRIPFMVSLTGARESKKHQSHRFSAYNNFESKGQ